MGTETQNLGLALPALTDNVSIAVLDNNFELIDAAIGTSVLVKQLDLVPDVKRDSGASMSLQTTTTTAQFTSGSHTPQLAAAIDFKNGQGIAVAGAGASGGLLVTSILSGAGTTTPTLAAPCQTTVASGATVYHDDTAAILAAIASIASTGGTPYIPQGSCNISSTIVLGNGSTSQLSTQNGIKVRGAGLFATTLVWNGVAGGTMAQIAGICQGNSFGDMTFNGQGVAGIGLQVMSGQYVDWGALQITGCDKCLQLTTLASYPSGISNTIGNHFGKLILKPNTGTNIKQCYGLILDGGNVTGDSNNNTFPNTHIYNQNNYQTAIRLGFCDFNWFGMVNVFDNTGLTGSYGLHIDGTVVSGFPGNNIFELANFGLAPLQTGTPGVNYCWHYDCGDGGLSLPAISGLAGLSDNPGSPSTPVIPFGPGAAVNIQGKCDNLLITTTNNTVVIQLANAVEGVYQVNCMIRVTGATTTVTAQAGSSDLTASPTWWLVSNGGAQINAIPLTVATWTCQPLNLYYQTGAATKPFLQVTCGTANQVFITASIIKVA